MGIFKEAEDLVNKFKGDPETKAAGLDDRDLSLMARAFVLCKIETGESLHQLETEDPKKECADAEEKAGDLIEKITVSAGYITARNKARQIV